MIWPFLMASVLLSSPVFIIINPRSRIIPFAAMKYYFMVASMDQKQWFIKPIDLCAYFITSTPWMHGVMWDNSSS